MKIREQKNISKLNERPFQTQDEVKSIHGAQSSEGQGYIISRLKFDQKIPVEVRKSTSNTTEIKGPMNFIKWDPLEMTAGHVKFCLVELGIFKQEHIWFETFLEIEENNSNPYIQITIEKDLYDSATLAKSLELIPFILNSMKNPQAISNLQFEENLTNDEALKIESMSMNFLKQNGGRVVLSPIIALCENQVIGVLKGKLGPKPDQSNFNATEVNLSGVIHGFSKFGEYFEMREAKLGDIKVFLGRTNYDLIEIAHLIKDDTKVNVSSSKTILKNGSDTYALIEIKKIDDGIQDLFHSKVGTDNG